MGWSEVLGAELDAGLPRLRGTKAVISVPIRQRVIDEVLRLLPGVPPDVTVLLAEGGGLQVRYGVFHANARLHPAARLMPAPVVTVELASQLVAWGLQRATLPPFVRITGRLVLIELGRVPGLERAAPLWRHVEQLSFESRQGQLDVRISVHVAERGDE